MTPEQAVLLSFFRGRFIAQEKNKIIDGQMAAVGLSKDEIVKLLPKGIYVACQNSSTNVTIAGPEDDTKAFVEKLIAAGIFARNVETSKVLFHTRYLEPSFPYLLEYAKTLIKDPKLRSSKWISTSVPETDDSPEWSQYNCAEYHYNNFANTVLFDQAYKYIPENAIVVEIGPHGILLPILKRELGSDVTFVSLTNRNSNDNEQLLLSAIGKWVIENLFDFFYTV